MASAYITIGAAYMPAVLAPNAPFMRSRCYLRDCS